MGVVLIAGVVGSELDRLRWLEVEVDVLVDVIVGLLSLMAFVVGAVGVCVTLA